MYNQNTDFILHSNQLIVEVKTPFESKKMLFEYIQEWKQQKQIKEISEKYPAYYKILVINTKYKHPFFGKIRGSGNFLNHKKFFWDCCIAYNSFNKDGDYIILNATKNEQQIINLSENLKGAKPISLISLGMKNVK